MGFNIHPPTGLDEKYGRSSRKFDEDFVDVVEDEWNCPICQLSLKEAVQTGVCGHRFCWQCIEGHSFQRLAIIALAFVVTSRTVRLFKCYSGCAVLVSPS